MIYSLYVTDATLKNNPSLVSKVRQDKNGHLVIKKSAIAYEGKCRLKAEANDYFGGEDSQTYLSRVLVNPTYATLFKHAKKSQEYTKDYHHDFFEGFWVSLMENDVAIIRLEFGS